MAVFVDRARRVRPTSHPIRTTWAWSATSCAVSTGCRSPSNWPQDGCRRSTSPTSARLDRSLDLLGDGRTVTLRRTIEWSYDLLPDHEQRLFRHLGVFPDGFDLATAESVAADLGVPADAAGALAHLVDASMVDATLGDVARYRMLDTIRSFAHDRLTAADEDDAATERFLHWAVDLATWFEQTIDTDDEPRRPGAARRDRQSAFRMAARPQPPAARRRRAHGRRLRRRLHLATSPTMGLGPRARRR